MDLLHLCFRPSFPFPDILEAGRPSSHLYLLPFPSLPSLLLLLLFPSPARLPSPLLSSLHPLGFSSSSPQSKRFHLPVTADVPSLLLALLPASFRPPCLPLVCCRCQKTSLPLVCCPRKTCLFPACSPLRTACPPCSFDQPSFVAGCGNPMVGVAQGRLPC